MKIFKYAAIIVVSLIGLFFAYIQFDEPYQEWKYKLDVNSPKTLALFNSVKIGGNFLKELYPNGEMKSDFLAAQLDRTGADSSDKFPLTSDGKLAISDATSYVAFAPVVKQTGTPNTYDIEKSAYIVILTEGKPFADGSIIKKVFLVSRGNIIVKIRE